MNEEPKSEISTVQTAAAEPPELKEIIEALLFASDEQVTMETLKVVFEDMNRDKPDEAKSIRREMKFGRQ